jgi:predicted deacylase
MPAVRGYGRADASIMWDRPAASGRGSPAPAGPRGYTRCRRMPILVRDPAHIDFSQPGVTHYQVAFHLDASWGYSLVPLTVINGTREAPDDGAVGVPPGVAVFGGTHGNEYEGQVAVTRLCRELDPAKMRGRVLLIPQLSERACQAHTRHAPEDGVNMNRAFPGDPRGTVSARIASFVKRHIFPQARVILDLHAGGREAIFPLCTSVHPLADPAQWGETLEVARLFDTPYVFVYSRQMASGLLTDEAEDEGRIAVGGEFGFGEAVSPHGVRHAYEGVKNVLRHYGLLDEPVVRVDPRRASPPRIVQAPALEDYVPSPRDGIWEPLVDPGDEVKAGAIIGRLHDFASHPAEALELCAHRDGVVIARYFGARCPKGATVFVLAVDL